MPHKPSQKSLMCGCVQDKTSIPAFSLHALTIPFILAGFASNKTSNDSKTRHGGAFYLNN